VQDWVVGNHWDSEVTSFTLRLLSQANEHHALLLIAIIAFCAVHIFNALLLVLGSLLRKRLLLLPWLVQDMLVIVLAAVVFVLWSFLSFFLHVLLAVCFPAVAGLLLGFWIYAWKNVRDLFHRLGSDAGPNHQGTIYRKLPASVGTSGGQGTRSLLGP
jgi:amino acid transporter